ncbi:sorbitol dehydrogenase [Aplysia californica]|uniref:Sorbitol dehydrogenase n=1 Tax=Aplysia californica TaxID=6500 RepID=A0ABM1A0H9_APLCA|nr:sorbitol dehydrogenase [Aplysia californica]
MADTNLTLTLYGIKDLRLEDKPIQEPGPGEVQISIRSVGICGSDVSYWQQGRIGDYVVTTPMVMGHEPSGVVTKLGQGVTHLSVGDRVAIEPNQPCGNCGLCKNGRYNLCEKLKYLATPPTHGCLARYYCHPANFVYKLPDNVSFDEGALVQPLALGFYACQRGNVSVGNYVLVCGAGPLGMAVVLAAKARGVAKICVTDISQERLDYIKRIGADVTVTVGKEKPRVTSSRVVEALGREADVSIECSGHYTSSSNAIYSTRATGTVVQIGFGGPTVEIPLVIATLKELDIRGMARFANNYETVIEAMATGKVNAKQLITHRFSLENAIEAYNAALRREGVKIIIDCTRN